MSLGLFGRFWQRVQFGGPEGCWIWIGARSLGPGRGYGSVSRARVDHTYAHHIAFELSGRTKKPDEHILHSCGEPACVNPRHLRSGSRSDNMLDKRLHGTQTFGEAHPTAKLTDSMVRSIRQRRLVDGLSWSRLAAEFGVSQGTVRAVVSGQTWSHVT